MDLLIFSDRRTPRVEYIFTHVFGNMLGLPFSFAAHAEELAHYNGPKLAYSTRRFDGALNMVPSGLLFEQGVVEQNMAFLMWDELPAFFAVTETSDIPFDLMAASFFLITRYEEYLPFTPDKHGRFPAKASYAWQMGFLELPLVDIWVERLAQKLKSLFPVLQLAEREFAFVPTIDIDNTYAFKHKGAGRAALGTFRALLYFRWGEVFRRMLVYFNLTNDPYNTYRYLFQTLRRNTQTVWFILSGGEGRWDRNISIDSLPVSRLIRRIAAYFKVGLHPSYSSANRLEAIGEEKSKLEAVLGQTVVLARQHFLRVGFPHYFQQLIGNGIETDFSLGYSNVVGYRASTCTPFTFYDLERNTSTKLLMVPLVVMDRALERNFGKDMERAGAHVLEMARKVQSLGGTFVLAWHNETLVTKQWRQVFADIVNRINELTIGDKAHTI